MYYSQALEGNLRHWVASAELRKDRELSIDDAYGRHAERALGQLVHRLKDLCELPPDQSRRLDAAVRSRNALAHDFVDERAHRLIDVQGRRGLFAELEREMRLLKDVNSEVLQIVTDPRLLSGWPLNRSGS